MIFKRYTRTVLEANCYVIAPEKNSGALVVDPGCGSAQFVNDVCAENGLSVAAVLLTHGHPDHCWDASEVSGGAPVYCPAPDLYRLDDPLAHLGPMTAAVQAQGMTKWKKPADIRPVPEELMTGSGAALIPGVYLRGLPAPGHTEGSTVFLTNVPLSADLAISDNISPWPGSGPVPVLLGGDVLFPTGAGRTDLPGGDPTVMDESLRTLKLAIDPRTVVFPGHGPAATMSWMLKFNPFLAGVSANCECGGNCSCK